MYSIIVNYSANETPFKRTIDLFFEKSFDWSAFLFKFIDDKKCFLVKDMERQTIEFHESQLNIRSCILALHSTSISVSVISGFFVQIGLSYAVRSSPISYWYLP